MRMKTNLIHLTPPCLATSQLVLVIPSPEHSQADHLSSPQKGSGLMGDNVTGSSWHSTPVATVWGHPAPPVTLS